MIRLLISIILLNILIFAKEPLLPTEKSIIEGELSNGFKYTIKKNSKPKDRAEFRLLVKVGSLEEEDDQKGIAHFTEHMAFNGTKHFKKNELIKYLESTGVKFGVHLNASTDYEKTLYKLRVPLERDNLKNAFLIFQDWAEGLNFNRDEFNKERGVILEEARVRDTAGFRIYNKSKKLFYGDTKYMQRVPIGDKSIIKNISVERAKEFYTTWYRPEFMHFIAVGDFNKTVIENMIKKSFSHLKNISHKKRASREIPDNNQTRVLSLTDREITSNSLTLSYVDKLEDTRTKSDLREAIIEEMTYQLFNMKAREQILKDNPKASSINLSSEKINSRKATYSFNVEYSNGDDKEALRELFELIKSFYKYGFSESDFRLVKKSELQSNEKEYRKVSDLRSSTIASQLVNYALSNSIYIDYNAKYRLKKELINKISLEDINREFKKIVNFIDRFILFINTDGTKVSKDEVLKIIDSAKASDLREDKKLPSKLIDRELKGSKILYEDYSKSTNIYGFILENGIKVIFKPTNFSKDRVYLKAFSFGGTSLYSAEDLDSVKKTSLFVNKSGVEGFSNIDLSKILAGRDIGVDSSISKLTEDIYAYANSRDLECMFELLYLKLTTPTIDKRVAKNEKKILKAKAKEVLRNPQNRFYQELSKWYQLDNPRVRFDTPESIDKLDINFMLEIYRDRFSDLNNFNFAIIGDIGVDKIRELIRKYLGSLPTIKRDECFIDREIEYRRGDQYFVRYYNNENISNILILYRTHIAYSKKRELALKALVSILNVRLRELIREDKSGVYGISIDGAISRLEEKKSNITISFSCDPKRRKELIDYIYKSIDKIKREFVSNKELNVYKKKFRVSYETNMREDSYWLNKMIDSHKFNEPLNSIYTLPELVNSITKEDIRDIANRVFREDRLQAELNPKRR